MFCWRSAELHSAQGAASVTTLVQCYLHPLSCLGTVRLLTMINTRVCRPGPGEEEAEEEASAEKTAGGAGRAVIRL